MLAEFDNAAVATEVSLEWFEKASSPGARRAALDAIKASAHRLGHAAEALIRGDSK